MESTAQFLLDIAVLPPTAMVLVCRRPGQLVLRFHYYKSGMQLFAGYCLSVAAIQQFPKHTKSMALRSSGDSFSMGI